MNITMTRATLADTTEITSLIAESARGLSTADYSDEIITAALRSAWGLDTQLLEDGTYYLLLVNGEWAACG